MVDRGMKKFNAFKALTEHDEMFFKLVEQKKRIEKPILSEEALEEINNNIMFVIHNNAECQIIYYENGFLKEISGFIKIDNYSKIININNKNINFCDIIKLNIGG